MVTVLVLHTCSPNGFPGGLALSAMRELDPWNPGWAPEPRLSVESAAELLLLLLCRKFFFPFCFILLCSSSERPRKRFLMYIASTCSLLSSLQNIVHVCACAKNLFSNHDKNYLGTQYHKCYMPQMEQHEHNQRANSVPSGECCWLLPLATHSHIHYHLHSFPSNPQPHPLSPPPIPLYAIQVWKCGC